MEYEEIRTIDYKFSELCDEIDYWKSEAMRWKKDYEEMVTEAFKRNNESLESSKRGIANALMFALSVKDDSNGNLIIEKEDRKSLAESWK